MAKTERSKDDVVKKIKGVALNIKEHVNKGEAPHLATPVRSLSNVEYDEDEGYFMLGDSVKERKLNASSVKTFAQTVLLLNEAKHVVETDDMMTKREAYYVSKNWGDARFKEQPESDTVMDDIEAMLRLNREELGFIPEEDGGAVAGHLTIIDENPTTGEKFTVDCAKMGTGAYNIPSEVEHLRFETDAKFIIAIETAGMFQRLVKHKYYDEADCILVSLKGVPSRATRRFVRRLSDEKDLPVYVFVDDDPYGLMNIYRTLKVGSGNAAHINEFFCVPRAHLLGVTPMDIEKYDLPTHKLSDTDIKRAKDALKRDPFVEQHKEWQDALKLMLKQGKRAEQQSLAKHGLNFVMETYLPEKLNSPDEFLP